MIGGIRRFGILLFKNYNYTENTCSICTEIHIEILYIQVVIGTC